MSCSESGPTINMHGPEDDVRCCLWYGVKGHALDECSKRLLVAQREMNDTLVATSSRLDTTNDRLGALEERADCIDAALINIQDIEADITTIKGQVERLLN